MLDDFVKDINSKYSDIDFVVFTGDNINRPNKADLVLFLKKIKPIKVRKYVLMGNHDLYQGQDMTKNAYMRTVKRHLLYHSNKPNYVFTEGKLVFVVMNGVKEVIPGPNGYYRQEELAWLDKTLTKYADKKVVILQHFPIIDTRVKSHNLYKKDTYLEVLKEHSNVIAIISGHYHDNKEVQDYGVYNIVTRNFAHNTYYKIIEINDEDGFIFTTLVENQRK